MGPATTLTACHGCLIGPGSFVFVTIRRFSFPVRHRDPESATVSSSSATHSGASLFGLLTRVLTVYARVSAGCFEKAQAPAGTSRLPAAPRNPAADYRLR